ncbi:MAG TPA: PAS domain S-box protein [Thermodesulfovibrionales bacterium]|nr:PAS domain S-box protein [Thermodesulfovibrionales bacterium]
MEKSDSILRILLQSAAECIIIVNRQGRIVFANNRTLDLFGYRSEELIGKVVEVLVPDRVREIHVARRNGYLTNPRNRPIGLGLDLSARKKDGSEFPVEISLSHAGEGADLMVMASISDITERKLLEEARAQLMERRIAELETTLRAFEEISQPPAASVTARMMGVMPLRDSAPAVFEDMVEGYGRIMEESIERRIFKIEGNLSNAIDDLGNRLGFLKATARDVVDLHSAVLKNKGRNASPARMRGYIEEGHFLLIELLGRVTTYYRNRAFGGGEVKTQNKIGLPKGEENAT